MNQLLRFSYLKVIFTIFFMPWAASVSNGQPNSSGTAPSSSINMENRYMIERKSSYLIIEGSTLGMRVVQGTFGRMRGTFFYNENDPATTSISVAMSEPKFSAISPGKLEIVSDSLINSSSLFDTERHPIIWFQSKSVQKNTDNSYNMMGSLNIKGKAKDIMIRIDRTSQVKIDEKGVKRVNFYGTGTIDRKDFDLKLPEEMEAMLGDKISIALNVTGFGWTLENVKNRFSKPEKDGSENLVTRISEIAMKKGTKSALKTYNSVQKKSPDMITKNTLANAGWYLMKSGYPNEAIALYNRGIADYPDHHNTEMRLGDAYVIAGDSKSAAETYRTSLNYYPNFHYLVEMLKQLEGDYR